MKRKALTRSLWVVEGLTDYYGDSYTSSWRADARRISRQPLVGDRRSAEHAWPTLQSVELASYDAWIAITAPTKTRRT